MEQAQKQLKISSLIVLLFAGLSLVQIITELAFGEINSATIPEGAPENILLITKIILLSVTLIFLLPKVYAGLKGLQIAKTPDSSQSHIIWAIVALIFEVVGFIDPILDIVNQGNIWENVVMLAEISLEVIILYEYIKYAKALSKLVE